MKADELIARAASISGLPVRGEASFRAGLDRFLAAFDRSPSVTSAGRTAVETLVLETLIARFRMEDWFARHPKLLEAPVDRPVFVLGMPRAGTTLLFNLLALDPQRRVYWSWEALREIPPAQRDHLHDDPRIARKVAEVEAALASGALDQRQHVEMGDEPAECTMILGQDFKSNLWMSQTPVPEYFAWLYADADIGAAYRYEKRVLQVLQSEAPGKWTLKLPSHAPFLGTLLEIFPDARIVMTHRDPAKVIPSSCAASCHFIGLASAGFDPHDVGAETMKVIEATVHGTAAARAAHPEVPVYDCHYRRFVVDPIAELRRIYDFLGDSLTADVEGRMIEALHRHEARRTTLGSKPWRLEDFGLTRAAVDSVFAGYMERYGVERE